MDTFDILLIGLIICLQILNLFIWAGRRYWVCRIERAKRGLEKRFGQKIVSFPKISYSTLLRLEMWLMETEAKGELNP